MPAMKLLFVGNFDFLNINIPRDVKIAGHLTTLNDDQIVNALDEIKKQLSQKEVNVIVLDERLSVKYPQLSSILATTGLPVVAKIDQIEGAKKRFDFIIKRLYDIIVSLVGLVITGLVAALIYPIVQRQSPGSLIFSQDRVGKNGKTFKMYKFRSMYLDAEERKQELMKHNEINSDLMFKLEKDPRIFPFGQKMRSWSIDELPQFINVLKGDMSLIGTRPPTVEEVAKYELHHFKRLAMRPGITGMWQVSGRSNIQDFEEVVKLDAFYIDNFSLKLDLKIILKTVKVVLLREGSK